MHRREFIGFVALIGIPALAGCSSDEDHGNDGCNGAGTSTSLESGHRHSVCVPAADISSPPSGGGTYATTSNDGHVHTVSLSAQQLTALGAGQTVTLQTSADGGHSHSVTFAAAPSTGGGY